MLDAETRFPPATPCYSCPVCAINSNPDVCHQPPPLPPCLVFLSLPRPPSSLHRDTSADEELMGDLLMWPQWADHALHRLCAFFFFLQSTCLLGLNGLKIAPVAVGEQSYQVPPPGGDVELLWVISSTCGEQKRERETHPASVLNLTGFISFSLKQKMIALQQAFSSKPSH